MVRGDLASRWRCSADGQVGNDVLWRCSAGGDEGNGIEMPKRADGDEGNGIEMPKRAGGDEGNGIEMPERAGGDEGNGIEMPFGGFGLKNVGKWGVWGGDEDDGLGAGLGIGVVWEVVGAGECGVGREWAEDLEVCGLGCGFGGVPPDVIVGERDVFCEFEGEPAEGDAGVDFGDGAADGECAEVAGEGVEADGAVVAGGGELGEQGLCGLG